MTIYVVGCCLMLIACDKHSPLAPDAASVTASLTPAPAQYTLSGQVSCPTKPIAASRVELVSGPDAGKVAVSDESGRYSFGMLTGGDLVLRASATGYQVRTVNVVLDANKTTDFLLVDESSVKSDLVSLSGVVVGVPASAAAPIALAAAQVSITAGPDRGRSARTDAFGRYQLDGLAPDDVTVEASATGYSVVSSPVNLRVGATADFRLTAVPIATTVAAAGRVVDLLSEGGLSGIAVAGDGLSGPASDPTGAFRLTMPAGTEGATRTVTFSGVAVVPRTAQLQLPAQNLVVSLIASAFDLAAFDEMFRGPLLRRWTSAPQVLLEQSAVQFSSTDMADGLALSDTMTGAEADGLMNDLVWALPQLTGNTFRSFQGVSRQTSAEGKKVPLLNPGVITVVRAVGLSAATGTWGWSRWMFAPNGTVVGGLVMIDRDFERSGSPFIRSLRAHELGHALGYAHVSRRTSVMNPEARLEPTPFDLDASRVAFQRQPGSRSPDIDPDVMRSPQQAGQGTWSAPIP